ncbi:hypothetical protein M011DRAFT_298276 [Sporormia fimetaria CBS 119925]|uniref:Uncharacterized protein n=1 Tax=Sporormia fimetaria CBS 119925 TaxID=1340428 RepID=A0A6A6UUX5_9PLEO|nr:hypothetical protein M011DRAFT_298276 [Sporormia fimetaria CBS 119925]
MEVSGLGFRPLGVDDALVASCRRLLLVLLCFMVRLGKSRRFACVSGSEATLSLLSSSTETCMVMAILVGLGFMYDLHICCSGQVYLSRAWRGSTCVHGPTRQRAVVFHCLDRSTSNHFQAPVLGTAAHHPCPPAPLRPHSLYLPRYEAPTITASSLFSDLRCLAAPAPLLLFTFKELTCCGKHLRC